MLCIFYKMKILHLELSSARGGGQVGPSPLPSPFSCPSCALPRGCSATWQEKGEGRGDKFQSGHRTLLVPLCHHPFLLFCYCFCCSSILVLMFNNCLFCNPPIPSQHAFETLMVNPWVWQMQHRTPIWIGSS